MGGNKTLYAENMKPLKHHLERIQNGDEATKHFWLYTLSSISMLFVLVLWGGYMNLAIPGVPGPIAEATGGRISDKEYSDRRQEITNKAQSPTSIFMAGLATIINGTGIRLSHGIATIKEALLPSNKTITIDKKQPRLIMKGLESLPNGVLPE